MLAFAKITENHTLSITIEYPEGFIEQITCFDEQLTLTPIKGPP